MKLMICGHGRHGKDTVAEHLQGVMGLTFQSSSMFACEEFIFEQLREKYGYATPQECFEDRANHRAEWYDAICEFNLYDKARLSKAIFGKFDMYVGIRNHEELSAAEKQDLFDLSIWVEADTRLPPESVASNTITRDMCDIVVLNNLGEADLRKSVTRLADAFIPF